MSSLLLTPDLFAQEAATPAELLAADSLPEAPSTAAQPESPVKQPDRMQPEVETPAEGKPPAEASRHASLIEPWETAPHLTAHDKMALGLRRTVSPMAIAGWFFSAGYGQLNDTPHYGSDRGGFGERLGAAALRDASEAVFTDGFAAPVFHQDPRYYRMGDRRSVGARIRHAALQPFYGRMDSGRRAINISLMTGTLAGSALTNAYYPEVDRGVSQTFETFAFSMEGSVIGNLVREFIPDLSGLVFSHIH